MTEGSSKAAAMYGSSSPQPAGRWLVIVGRDGPPAKAPSRTSEVVARNKLSNVRFGGPEAPARRT